MVGEIEIDEIVREAKEKLYEDFVKNWKWWWKEEDLQAHLYHLILEENEIPPRLVVREYRLITDKQGEKTSWGDRAIGDIDLAIINAREKFSLEDCEVLHTIEIKFARDLKDTGEVFTDSTRRDFAISYFRDYGKLWRAEKEAKNVTENFEKHLLFFEKFSDGPRPKNRLFKGREPDKLFKNPSKDYGRIKKCLKEEERGEGKEKPLLELDKVKKWRWYDGNKDDWQEFEDKHFDNIQFSYIEVGPDGTHTPTLINWYGEPGTL